MKRLLLLCTLCLSQHIFAQTPAIEVESALERATVFLNGAQVFRTVSARLPAGRSEVRFVRLDPDLNPESIQLKVDGLTVLSVTHQRNFLDPSPATVQVQTLRDRIQIKRDSIAIEQMMMDVFAREELMLGANQSIGGTASGVSPGQLELAANFFRRRLTEIKEAALGHEWRKRTLEADVQVLESQLQGLSASLNPTPSSEITVLVDRSTAGQSAFELSYVTRRAGWRPVYDLRVEDIAQPLTLHYKASIEQSTNEDWDNARLTLSTANPSQRGVRPRLSPQYVRFFAPIANAPAPRTRLLEEVVQTREAPEAAADMREPAPVPVQTRSNTTSMEFEIEIPYSIASDADPSLVDIAQHDVDALYEYYAAPAVSRDAYLTARLTNWEAYNLLSGSANLFFNDTFVGQSYLDMENVSDTLDLSLGIDQGIVIQRTRLEEFSRNQFLGGRRVDVAAYEIEVRNTKTTPVNIVVEDQIPLTSDGSIEVSLEEDGGARYTEETGLLRWEMEIPPGASETVRFRYTVRYPRDRTIVIRP